VPEGIYQEEDGQIQEMETFHSRNFLTLVTYGQLPSQLETMVSLNGASTREERESALGMVDG